MKQVLEILLRLQSLELGAEAKSSQAAEELRKRVPAEILQHYDKLRTRGKKGVALVRHGVCAQCHMQVAVGLMALLFREDTLQRCETCGAYLYRAEDPQPVMEIPPRSVKPGRRGRPRKTPANAA